MPRYKAFHANGVHVLTVYATDDTAALASVARTAGYTVALDDLPRAPDDPCDPDCPGWAVFEVDRCTVHGDDCDGWEKGCSKLEIEACIECWHGQQDPMTDDDYAAHPVCLAQLAREREVERG